MRPVIRSALVASLLLLAAPLRAQQVIVDDDDFKADWTRPTRFDVGVNGVGAQAVHEFGDYIRGGFGGNVFGMMRLDRNGWLALRADLGFIQYGRETQRVRLLPTSGRITADLTTTNNIFSIGVGPELRVPYGPVRPYVNASVAYGNFFTESSVKGTNDTQEFASSTNYDDGTQLYRAGGGFYIPFARRSWSGGMTIGATYNGGGRASYLRAGSIEDGQNGTVTYHPIESSTDFWTYEVGVRMTIPHGRR